MKSYLKGNASYPDRQNMSWKEFEYFDNSWKIRIKKMSEYISDGEIIYDLGCGKEWLKEFISNEVTYIPVDQQKRSTNTILCEFNNYEFPSNIDPRATAFVSGCLEYLEDPQWFLDQIADSFSKAIISYCILENISNIEDRNKTGWKNHLLRTEIIERMTRRGFKLKDEKAIEGENHIFYFIK